MTVRVAIPVKLARLRVWVDKGRRWSSVDRLILWALAAAPRTAGALAEAADLPPPLVNEIVVRMMHFGWVELAATSAGAAFQATAVGQQALNEFEDLPPITRRVGRRISFAILPCGFGRLRKRDHAR